MTSNGDLGTMLRGWRDRLDPVTIGLPQQGTRRSSGLRREELASLAGLSVDYVVRLEQGRAKHPSEQVLGALARALHLSDDEREHLYRLAGAAIPDPGLITAQITPGVQRLVDRMSDVPVSVNDASWTLLAWNPLWAALIGDPSQFAGRDRNLVWRHFSGGTSRVRQTPEQLEAFERNMTADLRAATARYPKDRALHGLVADLRWVSPRFEELWASGEVGVHRNARKSIEHPAVGRLTLDCDILLVSGSDLRIIAYTAEPASEDAEKLALLRVLGTQELAAH